MCLGAVLRRLKNSSLHSHRYLGWRRVGAAPACLWEVDLYRQATKTARGPWSAEVSFELERDTTVNALAVWFAAELAPGYSLSNGPGQPESHWGHLLYPLERPVEVSAAAQLDVAYSGTLTSAGSMVAAWATRLDGREWSHHDERLAYAATR